MSEKQLLIVEDEKPIADILAYGFRREGFAVRCAYTGAEGLRMAEEERPDLVLLDWMLPDLSGVDVCRMLTETYNVPIVMLTARSSVDDKLLGLETGADDYITKPFDLREVVGRVRAILRRFDKTGRDAPAPEAQGVRAARLLRAAPAPGLLARPAAQPRLGLRLRGRQPHRGHPRPAPAQEAGPGRAAAHGLWRGL